jgi:hypothetical protein
MNLSVNLDGNIVNVVDVKANGSMAYIIFIDSNGNLRVCRKGFDGGFSSDTSADSVIFRLYSSITNWTLGTSATITWNFIDVLSNVKLELSRDNGFTWEDLNVDYPNTGEFTWVVTGSITNLALVRISGLIYTDPIDGSQIDFTDIVDISIPFIISA